MEPIKVLLVDDHALFRKGLYSVLAEDPSLVITGEAKNGLEAYQKALETKPDVILMDINMPEMDGVVATKKILAQLPEIRIIMLTFEEDEEYLFEAVKSGARGYLLKDLEPDDLFGYIKVVMRGEAPVSKTMASKMLLELGNMSKAAASGPDIDTKGLSIREKDVLKMVARGATNKEIASELHISENTVKNHMRNILEKLHMENRAKAAAYAIGEGII